MYCMRKFALKLFQMNILAFSLWILCHSTTLVSNSFNFSSIYIYVCVDDKHLITASFHLHVKLCLSVTITTSIVCTLFIVVALWLFVKIFAGNNYQWWIYIPLKLHEITSAHNMALVVCMVHVMSRRKKSENGKGWTLNEVDLRECHLWEGKLHSISAL